MSNIWKPAVPKTEKIIPVILASNALSRLWPISSAAKSYALHQQKDGLSPLQKLLKAIAKSQAYGEPTIIVQEGALRTSQAQIQAAYEAETSIIATMPSVSSGMLCALTSVLSASKSANAKLVYLPATLTAPDETALVRYLTLFAETANNKEISEDGKICFAASPRRVSNAQISFILNHRPTRSGLSDVASIQTHNDAHLAEQNILDEEGCLTSPIGPAIVRASAISELLAADAPMVLQACNFAIDTSEKSDNILRPNGHFMTLCPSGTLVEIVASSPEKSKILTCGTDLSVVRDWANPLAQSPDSAPIDIQTVGNTNAKTIAHANRVLVIGDGGESGVTIPKLRALRTQEINVSDSYCIEQHDHSAVWKHALAPNQTKPNECHFHRSENITIIAGNGIAYIDEQEIELSPGTSIQLPPSTCHEIHNSGTEPLIYFELRMGKMYDDDDRLYIPREAEKRKSA